MEAYNNSIYPVFEADQVLSQKELNALVSHLEEQDRLTRKNLIGIGIVCGLDITFPNTKSVTIACGTAVTSLGLKEAKDLVEEAPKEIKSGVNKKEAEEIKQKLEAAGAKVELK